MTENQSPDEVTNSSKPTGGRNTDILSSKQELFCWEYMKDLNAKEAYIRAGFSRNNATTGSTRLMKNPLVKALIKKLKAELAKKMGVTIEMIVEEYRKIAFSNIKDFLSEKNEITDIAALPKNKTAVVEMVKKTVTEFEGGTTTSVQLKLHSKIAGLDALGRHLGFFEKDNSQKAVSITVSRIKK